jgi:hypothetical protein
MSAHATAPEPHDSSHGQAVAVAHISNALGTVTPVKEIVEMTHRLGCWCGDLRPSLPTQKATRITAVPTGQPAHRGVPPLCRVRRYAELDGEAALVRCGFPSRVTGGRLIPSSPHSLGVCTKRMSRGMTQLTDRAG